MGEFGSKFRRAREKKELSLDDVSNVTKIGARMLQAIEEERFDQLPGGVFNKGFIRAYARHLGLNDEDAVTDYLACLRQAQIDAHEVWEPQPQKPGKVEPRKSQPSPPAVKSQPAVPAEELPELQLPRAEHVRPRQKDFAAESRPEIPWRIIGVAAVVVILALLLWTRRSHNPNTAAASTLPPQSISEKVALAKPEASKPESLKPAPMKTTSAGIPGTAPKSTTSASPAAGVTATPAHTSAPTSQPPQPSASALATGLATTPATVNQNDVIVRTFPKTSNTNAQPSAKAAAPLTLVIRATETSWISVLADGQPVSQETLIAPAHTSVRATREIVARIGNAAGVTFLWNGQEVPADGAEAEVKTFVFDSAGMRVVPSTPAAPDSQ